MTKSQARQLADEYKREQREFAVELVQLFVEFVDELLELPDHALRERIMTERRDAADTLDELRKP